MLGMGVQQALRLGLPPTREVALKLFRESAKTAIDAAHAEHRRLGEAVDPVALRAATARLLAEPEATSVVRPAAKGVARAEQEGWKRLRIAQQAEGEERDTLKLAVVRARQAEGAMSARGRTLGGVKPATKGSTFQARANVWKSWQVEFTGHRSEAEAQRTVDVLYIIRGDAPGFFPGAGE